MSQRLTIAQYWSQLLQFGAGALAVVLTAVFVTGYVVYTQFRIDVPSGKIAVLIRRTGTDITNAQETAPSIDHKGLQAEVLNPGRYFRNPYYW